MAAIDKWISGVDPAMHVGKVARQAVGACLGNVIRLLPLAAHQADDDVKHVHAARVATRRAGAALSVFRDLMPKGRRKAMKQSLKGIRSSMGDARDLDVYIHRFGKSKDPGARLLLKSLKRRRRAAQKSIVECATPLLEGEHLRVQVDRLLKKTKRHAHKSLRRKPFGDWAVGRLRDEWGTLLVAVPGDQPSAEQLHDFRIATKRFRYAVELLSQGLPISVREVVYPQVKRLQGQLGEIQDHAEAAERLHTWRTQANEPQVSAMLGQLEQHERDQYENKCQAFLQKWHRDGIGELHTAVEAVWRPPSSRSKASYRCD